MRRQQQEPFLKENYVYTPYFNAVSYSTDDDIYPEIVVYDGGDTDDTEEIRIIYDGGGVEGHGN